jgi:hypothetical protein
MRPYTPIVIACTAALAGTAAFAQTPPQPEAAQPAAPTQAAPAPAPAQSTRGRPANICQELVAFLTPKPAAAGAPATTAAPAAAAATAPAPAASGTSVPQGAAAPAVEAARSPQPQNTTAPQRSGQTAPIPQEPAAAKPAMADLAQVQAMAAANDIKACRDTAQSMRMAGMALPAGLIALAGLRLELLEQAVQP